MFFKRKKTFNSFHTSLVSVSENDKIKCMENIQLNIIPGIWMTLNFCSKFKLYSFNQVSNSVSNNWTLKNPVDIKKENP